ncbi:hypothetical protein N7530_007007 [Penicillium desertorum]|uniref:Uncharacterized protein n=1 Tax=Penicillium desertorum TaxID=1303715 RepID=A0A9W9WT23_9EURO|nr:hypothetical protein N7530_007007 [Penicillium desertorum]
MGDIDESQNTSSAGPCEDVASVLRERYRPNLDKDTRPNYALHSPAKSLVSPCQDSLRILSSPRFSKKRMFPTQAGVPQP